MQRKNKQRALEKQSISLFIDSYIKPITKRTPNLQYNVVEVMVTTFS